MPQVLGVSVSEPQGARFDKRVAVNISWLCDLCLRFPGLCGEQVLVESYIPGKSLTEYYIDPVKQEIDPPRQHLGQAEATTVEASTILDS